MRWSGEVELSRRVLPGRHDLLALAAAWPSRYPCLLESVAEGSPRARFDVLFGFPQSSLALGADGRVHDGEGRERSGTFLDALDAEWQASRMDAVDDDLPFHGGWVLFLAYELAAQIEPRLALPALPDLPVALALRCPVACVVDREREVTWLVAEESHAGLLDALQSDLDAAQGVDVALPALRGLDEDAPEHFLGGVASVHAHLLAGDVFQANLSREWRVHFTQVPQPAGLYDVLRRANPAPFAGLLQQPGWALASSSPERLVERRGELVQTRPIAGTRPRLPGEDVLSRIRELHAHPKERAEHVMLVDLERNDLGRVCCPGTVVVDELMAVESYAHVHHIVSNVRGILREGVTPGQLIAATFPGGTITGCPKVRCMEIVAALERTPRGAYTGALGYLDRSGDMDLNILIRSLVQVGDSVRLRAGAGIVADSDAPHELDETRAKARGLLRALGLPG